MSNNMTSKPFFARFLESQEAASDATLKFPSDQDEEGGLVFRSPEKPANEATLKFPSDQDEEGGGW